MLAFIVTQRSREIGVRMALGSGVARVIRLVLGDAVLLIATGVAAGVPAALGLARLVFSRFSGLTGTANPLDAWLGSQAGGPLFGLKSVDLATILISVLLMGITGAIAACVPALRASRIDPTRALRME